MPEFYSALMIDLDGTMVDTLADFEAVLRTCLHEMALPTVDAETVKRMVGKGSEHLIRSTLAMVVPSWMNLDPIEQQRLYQQAWDLYQTHYPRHNGKHSRVYPGVVEGLQKLKESGIPMTCLTNKPLAFALALLQDKHLDHYFQFVFGGDSFPQKKPHPAPLLGACAALNTAPNQTLMVGDSSNDALAARAAGCPVALVTYGYNHGQDVSVVSHDYLIDSLAQLFSICIPSTDR